MLLGSHCDLLDLLGLDGFSIWVEVAGNNSSLLSPKSGMHIGHIKAKIMHFRSKIHGGF